MPLHLDIDAHGRVAPEDEAARRLLADRAGRFAVLPSAPDLLVGRRVPAAGGAAARPRCRVAGDLGAFPIADFVAFVHQSKLSGLLTVASAGHERVLAFSDGEVRGAQSDAAGERLGEIAVRLGLVAPDAVASALEGAGTHALGKVLVERGLLSASDLWRCLHEQVAAVFHAVLLAREGVFALVDDELSDLGSALSLSTQSLLMDGVRRIDELSLFRARIPGPEACVRRREPRVRLTLQAGEAAVLAHVDGRRTVAEVASAARLGEFDATKILYHLAEAGYVEATGRAAEAPRSAAERTAAVAAGMDEILREIAAALSGPGGLDPLLAAARSFLGDPVGRFAPVWAGVAARRDGGVDVERVRANVEALPLDALAALEPSRDRARLLFDALHELVLFYLFQAGERLARADDERLGREVKRRFEALDGLR